MTTRSTDRLHDPAWRAQWLTGDARWDVDVLEIVHRVSADDWHYLEYLRDLDYTPQQAAEALFPKGRAS